MATATQTIDAMERLINDADVKFEEKFRSVQQGIATNLTAYSDRTFNLRQQMAHNTQLTNDEHFMEMLSDTERFLAPEYSLRGEVDRRLQALLAGLLKTLLRETISLASYSARKIQLEMAYNWYQDKTKQLLDFQLQRQKERESHDRERGKDGTGLSVHIEEGTTSPTLNQTGGSSTPCFDVDGEGAKQKASTRFLTKYAALREGVQTEPIAPSGPSLSFIEDTNAGKQHATIAKKLGLYKKRNLAAAEKLRRDLAQSHQQASAGEAQDSGVRIVRRKSMLGRPSPGGGGGPGTNPNTVVVGGKHGGLPGGNPIQGPPTFLHMPESKAPGFYNPAGSTALSMEEAMANAQKHWVNRMAQRVEEEHDAKKMEDMLTMMAYNHARVEEESNRRMESDSFAAQTGRACHRILRRHNTRPSTAGATAGAPQPKTAQEEDVQRQLASLPRDEMLQMLNKVTYQGTDVSLSPYDAYQPTPVDEKRIKALLSRVATPDDRNELQKRRHGLKSVHPTSIASTSQHGCTLDVAPAPDMQVTKTLPRTDTPIMELLYPALAPEQDVPSQRRMKELHMVERIRECFARTKGPAGKPMHLSRGAIERAVLTPDDRPYDECIRLLPSHGGGFAKDYRASTAQSKKRK